MCADIHTQTHWSHGMPALLLASLPVCLIVCYWYLFTVNSAGLQRTFSYSAYYILTMICCYFNEGGGGKEGG